jgi:Ca-activated chloride channel family protein
MNTQRFLLVFVILLLVLSACAPAAGTQAPAAPVATASRNQPTGAARPQSTQAALPLVPANLLPAPTQPTVQNPDVPLPANSAPGDNTFQDYGVNPIVDTRLDHLSTFGLDVDTASYTVARTYVMDGSLPPYDAVRAEEFINYFNAGYANPSDVGFAVYADGAPAPFPMGGRYVLRFGVQGYAVPAAQRKPANLVFVIDTSGSMNEQNRLDLVKQSLNLLVDRLYPDDSVAIVQFGTTASTVLEPTSGSDQDAILSAIRWLTPDGSTNVEQGLELGYQSAMKAFKPDGINRVILCSDGVANSGLTDPDAILSRIHGYISEGITLTTVGVGMGNFNDVLLEQMADKGNGQYFYVDNLEEARRVFVDQITGTLQVIAKDAKVQVDFNPDVVARYRLIGYENRAIADQNFRNDSVDAGEIGAGISATALYVVDLTPGAAGRLATVQLRWKDPDGETTHEINGNVNTWDLASSFEDASPRYQLAVAAGEYAEILRQSPYTSWNSIDDLARCAHRLAESLSSDPDVVEFADLVARASQLGE